MTLLFEILTFSNEGIRNAVAVWAQIITAVGTIGATIGAVMLGSRPHRQIIKLTFGKRIQLFLGSSNSKMSISGLAFNIINTGILPVPLWTIELIVYADGSIRQIPISCSPESELPVTLDYGERHSSSITFEDDDRLWMRSVPLFMLWRRPKVRVTTATGKEFIFRFPIRLMRQLYISAKTHI